MFHFFGGLKLQKSHFNEALVDNDLPGIVYIFSIFSSEENHKSLLT